MLRDNKAIQMVSVVLHFVLELGDQEPIDLPVQVAHSCASATAQHSPSFWPFQILLQYHGMLTYAHPVMEGRTLPLSLLRVSDDFSQFSLFAKQRSKLK